MLFPLPKEFHLPFVKKIQESKDTYSFFFDRAEFEFDFLPGQYLRMFLDIQQPDERGTNKLFSIASSPLEKDHIMITTKILKSTFKKKLAELTPGTRVRFFGPAGRFVLDETDLSPRVFLGGGIGITPMHCMTMYAAEKKLPIPIWLFASFSVQDDLIYYDQLRKIGEENQNIKIIYTITREESIGKNWTGETGRISPEMFKKYSLPSDALWYMAGPPEMAVAMKQMVSGMNVPPEYIKAEQFTGY